MHTKDEVPLMEITWLSYLSAELLLGLKSLTSSRKSALTLTILWSGPPAVYIHRTKYLSQTIHTVSKLISYV